MITDLWIENFKGIGKRQHIPLRPITLLFGANSAGKSSVLHAILYLRRILATGNCNPAMRFEDETGVTLGDFDSILHRDGDRTAEFIRFSMRIQPNNQQTWEFMGFAKKNSGVMVSDTERATENEWLNGEHWPAPSLGPQFPKCPSTIDAVFTIAKVDRSLTDDAADDFSTEQTPIVTEFELIVDGFDFMRTKFDAEEAIFGCTSRSTIVSLINPIWNDRFAINSAEFHSPEYVLNHWRTHFQLRSELESRGQQSVAALDCDTHEPLYTLVTRVIEVPLYVYRVSNPAAIIPDGVGVMTLNDYLDQIRPESATEPQRMIEPDCTAVVFHRVDDFAADGDPNQSLRLSRLVGIAIHESNNEFVNEIICCIRDYLFTESLGTESENCRGRWGAFVNDEGRSALPESNWRLTPSPHVIGARGGGFSSTEMKPDIVFQTSLRWLTESLGEVIHIGPKRATVPRNFNSLTAIYKDNWNDGLAAWAWLLRNPTSVNQVCELLHGSNWLNSAYRIELIWKAEVEYEDSIVAVLRRNANELPPALRGHSAHQLSSDVEELQRALLDLQTKYEALEYERSETHRKSRAYQRLVLTRHRPSSSTTEDSPKTKEAELHPQDVGEGLTQVIPVLAAFARASNGNDLNNSGPMLMCEQPELHLHPSLAAKLADVFIDATHKKSSFKTSIATDSTVDATSTKAEGTFANVKIRLEAQKRERRSFQSIVETHSEHMILRILRRIRQTTNDELPKHLPPVKPDEVCVLWVDNLGDGTTFTRLRISPEGRWLDRWPDGFFSERHEELFE